MSVVKAPYCMHAYCIALTADVACDHAAGFDDDVAWCGCADNGNVQELKLGFKDIYYRSCAPIRRGHSS